MAQGSEADEPLLQENKLRFTIAPIEHTDVWDMYKKAQACYWQAEELRLEDDIHDWEVKLNDNERLFLEHVLAFFAASDGIVNENLAATFANEVQWPEARAFYCMQLLIETVHSESYSLMIDTYVKDKDRKLELLRGVETLDAVKMKADWARQYCDKGLPFAVRLVAWACVEGIHFSGAFAAIFWLKSRSIMHQGLGVANAFIARDEALHRDFAVLLYSKLVNRLSERQVHDIIRSAVDVEETFVRDSIPVRLISMNADAMLQYIQFCADHLAVSLGYGKLFNVRNPFPFMDQLSLAGVAKTNFFELQNDAYKMASVGDKPEEQEFSLESAF